MSGLCESVKQRQTNHRLRRMKALIQSLRRLVVRDRFSAREICEIGTARQVGRRTIVDVGVGVSDDEWLAQWRLEQVFIPTPTLLKYL